jgi:hypothetical protein
MASSLADRLRAWVSLRESGAITLPADQASDRASRALVYAALLRAARVGRSSAPPARLLAWVGVQRDVRGGYGSPGATSAVVRALLAHFEEAKGTARVKVTAGGAPREVEVGPSARVVVPLDPGATAAEIAVVGPGVVARFERPALRRWTSPPDALASPVTVEVTWPKQPRAGRTGKVQVSLRHALDRPATVDVRIPLPPGVSLALPVSGVRQIQGTLALRTDLPDGAVSKLVEIPVRFALRGRVTVPEARARVAFEDLPRAVAPARPLQIR